MGHTLGAGDVECGWDIGQMRGAFAQLENMGNDLYEWRQDFFLPFFSNELVVRHTRLKGPGKGWSFFPNTS